MARRYIWLTNVHWLQKFQIHFSQEKKHYANWRLNVNDLSGPLMAAFTCNDDFGADICPDKVPQNGRSTKTNHLHRQNDEILEKMRSGTRRLLRRLPENGYQYSLCEKTELSFFQQIKVAYARARMAPSRLSSAAAFS